MFKKAERKRSKLRLGLIGPSGSGKTYSALLIAQGLGGRIAMIDTERGSGSLYADLCDYDVCELAPPYTPEKYIQAVRAAESGQYDVLIIDSLSHAWAGEGGILEFVDKAAQSLKNNFAAWREASPKHNSLVDTLIGTSCHIIGTMRSKTAWDVQKDERTGKTKPVKIGLAPVQREGMEYEFTTVLDLSIEGHVATASKDRTGLFDGRYFTPNQETGEQLRQWLFEEPDTNEEPASGAQYTRSTPQPQAEAFKAQSAGEGEAVQAELDSTTMTDLFNLLRELGLADKLDQYERYLWSKYCHGIRDLDPAELQEQYANLSRCQHDADLLDRFRQYLEGLRRAA